MHHLANCNDSSIANAKLLTKSLEGAILTAMAEATALERIERHRIARNICFRGKCEPCFFVDETPDQPSRCGAINSRPVPGYPKPAYVILRIDLGRLPHNGGRSSSLYQQFLDTFLQR